jgi:hypothetical protein
MANPVLATCAHVVRISDGNDHLGHRGDGAAGEATNATGSDLGQCVRRGSSTCRLGRGGTAGSSLACAWGDAEAPAGGGLGAGILSLSPRLPEATSMPPGRRVPACTALDPLGKEESSVSSKKSRAVDS